MLGSLLGRHGLIIIAWTGCLVEERSPCVLVLAHQLNPGKCSVVTSTAKTKRKCARKSAPGNTLASTPDQACCALQGFFTANVKTSVPKLADTTIQSGLHLLPNLADCGLCCDRHGEHTQGGEDLDLHPNARNWSTCSLLSFAGLWHVVLIPLRNLSSALLDEATLSSMNFPTT